MYPDIAKTVVVGGLCNNTDEEFDDRLVLRSDGIVGLGESELLNLGTIDGILDGSSLANSG